MNNILNREDLCRLYPAEVALKSGSRVVPAIVTLAGIILVALSGSLGDDQENLSTALFTLAIVVLAFGIIKLIRPSRTLFCVATGEKVTRRFEGHEQEARAHIEQALKDGNFELLDGLKAAGSSAPLVSVSYTTPSGSLRIGQLLHYVPYEYQPLMEPVVHKNK